MKGQIEGAVSSSDASTEKLKSLGITVFDLNSVDRPGIYVDGADEINGHMQMIKGGGAALTREKIIASVADKFICIADASKQVDILGKFPLPVEVIPMARSAVARQLVKLGGRPEYRQGVVTDNGNVILTCTAGNSRCDRAGKRDQRYSVRRHRGAVRQPWRRRGADWHCRRREDHRKIVCPQEPTGSSQLFFIRCNLVTSVTFMQPF